MTPIQLLANLVVRPSFERCCGHGPEFFDAFYATLAVRVPGVTELFRGVDMLQQNQLIREGVARLIDFAEGRSAAREELERLRRTHGPGGLAVPAAWYASWIETLITTVREFDPAFTEPHGLAWRQVVEPGVAIVAGATLD